MHERGWSDAKVKAALRKARKQDLRFDTGQVLGSMCTAPEPTAAWAFGEFLETNLGDPGHFPGTAELEKQFLADMLELLHAPRGAEARLVSGGTEANLLACYLAREASGKDEIVVPESAHFSFDKAARLLRMRLVTVPTAADGRADEDAMAAAITKDTAIVVAVAGTTELGLVDPIASLAKLCAARKVWLHVDAAYGGYLLSFLPKAPRFDFALPGVSSISMDPHKGGMAPIPAGVLALRAGADWGRAAVPSPYLSTRTQSTILGTRPGAAAAAAWAAHRKTGRAGYAKLATRCLATAKEVATVIHAMGLDLVAPPELGVVTFRHADPRALAARLHARGFGLNVVSRMKALRVVVNPHVTPAAAKRFLKALEAER